MSPRELSEVIEYSSNVPLNTLTLDLLVSPVSFIARFLSLNLFINTYLPSYVLFLKVFGDWDAYEWRKGQFSVFLLHPSLTSLFSHSLLTLASRSHGVISFSKALSFLFGLIDIWPFSLSYCGGMDFPSPWPDDLLSPYHVPFESFPHYFSFLKNSKPYITLNLWVCVDFYGLLSLLGPSLVAKWSYNGLLWLGSSFVLWALGVVLWIQPSLPTLSYFSLVHLGRLLPFLIRNYGSERRGSSSPQFNSFSPYGFVLWPIPPPHSSL